jgi:hypothetical protein
LLPATILSLFFARTLQDPSVTVFLLSVRTGAVGLTLTRANRVYLMEPAVNPALEQQVPLRARLAQGIH